MFQNAARSYFAIIIENYPDLHNRIEYVSIPSYNCSI